jgi:hypothetical protein
VLQETFQAAISTGIWTAGMSAQAVLRRLATLLAVSHMDANMGDFLEGGYLTGVYQHTCVHCVL